MLGPCIGGVGIRAGPQDDRGLGFGAVEFNDPGPESLDTDHRGWRAMAMAPCFVFL